MKEILGPVAVRSSAAAEDSADASFAGQFETYLDVTGDSLLESVKACWASTVNERVRAYAAAHGVPDSLAIAVVVQSQVPAESSGVLFTANPRSGKLNEMVVNVTSGLGEKLVSGMVTPDVYILDKTEKRIKARTLHSKNMEGESAEVRFDDDTAAQLLDIGEKAKKEFGSPQDIEWAFADGKVWCLQSRPITTLVKLPARPVPYSNYYVWTNVNFAETMPHPVSPFGWSLMETGAREIFLRGLPMTGRTPFKVFEIIYGRPYWEMTFFFRSKFRLKIIKYGLSNLDARLPEMLQKIADEREFKVDPLFKTFDRYRFHLKVVGFALKHISGMFWAILATKRYAKRIWRWDKRLEKRVHEAVEIEGDWRDVLRNLHRAAESMWKSTYDLYLPIFLAGFGLFSDYFGFWRKWIGTDLDINHLTLVEAETDKTVACGNALLSLARMAKSIPEVASILQDSPREKWLAQLESGTAAEKFIKQFDEFIYRFGHRGPSEQDIVQPHYADKPELALMVVRNMMAMADGPLLGIVDEEKRRRDLKRVKEHLKKKPFGRIRHFILNTYRKLLGPVLPYRENGKHILFKFFMFAKRMALKAAEGMVKEKIISDHGDIFFLKLPELVSLAHKPVLNVNEIRDTIRTRRADFMRYQGVAAPMIVVSDGECIYPEPEITGEDEITGEGVSSGVATGKVRVVHDPYGDVKLEPGEILVAPQTDPGWTPLFVGAGGVIAEVGGMLSHSAVVAREYGIPAVVNVSHATRILKDGEEITIDGTRGKIYRRQSK
jgi:pyruvate,water dikinase